MNAALQGGPAIRTNRTMLYRLLYISTATDQIDHQELEVILDGAQTRNAALGVTGLLVFTGSHFMQLLEGEQDAVERVFASISKDPRHHSLAKIICEPSLSRACPDWSMMLERPIKGETSAHEVFVPSDRTIAERLPKTMPADLRLLFESFRSVMGRQNVAAG